MNRRRADGGPARCGEQSPSPDGLERRQVWVYLGAVLAGLGVGTLWPQTADGFEAFVWPVLAGLLFATFTQTPLASIPAAFRDARFLVAALIGNFVALPALAWGLVLFTPDDDPLRLGLLLVLLVPCTDWFITFSQLGRGDPARATALTPLNLVVQLLLLPLYLWLMVDATFSSIFSPAQVWPALVVVVAPLAVAALCERWFAREPVGQRLRVRLGWWPVPLLGLVIFLVAAAHVGAARDSAHLLPVVVGVAAAFLAGSLGIAKLLAAAVGLLPREGRTLAFSLGTRNSFIVLPFALSLPTGWETAAIVIVMQSLVELFAMVFYLWFVPRIAFPAPAR